MIDQITATLIAQKQAANPGFTLNDAADVILNRAAFSTSMGVPVDPYDLALAVAPMLGVGARQELGIVQAVLRRKP